MIRTLLAIAVLCVIASPTPAAEALSKHTWNVDGAAREAMIYAPDSAKTAAAPLVFVFHGHGGTMQGAVAGFAIHKNWPEAIVVYPQGLNTASRIDPEGKKPGWALSKDNNKDLKLFDAMLESVKKDYKVDDKRVFVTGHSNGGAFTYLLWEKHGDILAALAPSSAPGAIVVSIPSLKPRPVLHVAGEKDALVSFESQRQTMDALRKLNGCDATGQAWAPNATLFPSKTGTPLVEYIHPGPHQYPKDVPALIAKFFKEQSLKS